MDKCIFIKASLTKDLCLDIIELFSESNTHFFIIPKKSDKWEKIELFLYKQLLININEYKTHIIKNNINNLEIISDINKKLFTKHFKIQTFDNVTFMQNKNRNPNRYNLFTFIFYLNEPSNDTEICIKDDFYIKPKIGELIIFPDTYTYKYKTSENNSQSIIFGELEYFEDDIT